MIRGYLSSIIGTSVYKLTFRTAFKRQEGRKSAYNWFCHLHHSPCSECKDCTLRPFQTRCRFSFFYSFTILNHTAGTSPYATPVITHLVIPIPLFSTRSSPHKSIQQYTNNPFCMQFMFILVCSMFMYKYM